MCRAEWGQRRVERDGVVPAVGILECFSPFSLGAKAGKRWSAGEGPSHPLSLTHEPPFTIRFCPSPSAPLCPSRPLFRCKRDCDARTSSSENSRRPPLPADREELQVRASVSASEPFKLGYCKSGASLRSAVSAGPPVWPSSFRTSRGQPDVARRPFLKLVAASLSATELLNITF